MKSKIKNANKPAYINYSVKSFPWVLCKPFASVLDSNSSSINLEYLQMFYFNLINTYPCSSFFNSLEWQHLVAAVFIGTV